MTISVDTLLNYKKMYNENWKKKIINQFDLDEDITEEEIRNKYLQHSKVYLNDGK